jgi:hypothetical protein
MQIHLLRALARAWQVLTFVARIPDTASLICLVSMSCCLFLQAFLEFKNGTEEGQQQEAIIKSKEGELQ